MFIFLKIRPHNGYIYTEENTDEKAIKQKFIPYLFRNIQ